MICPRKLFMNISSFDLVVLQLRVEMGFPTGMNLVRNKAFPHFTETFPHFLRPFLILPRHFLILPMLLLILSCCFAIACGNGFSNSYEAVKLVGNV